MNDPTEIYCPVRKKWVVNTPEEQVRQSLIKYLHLECGAPLHLMTCEYPLSLNGRSFRADLVLHDRRGQPLLLVECKAPEVKLGAAVTAQLQLYNTVLHAPYLMISNGRELYLCQYQPTDGRYIFLPRIPTFDQLCL